MFNELVGLQHKLDEPLQTNRVQAFSVYLFSFSPPHKNQTLLSHFIASAKRLSVVSELTTSRILSSHESLHPNYFCSKEHRRYWIRSAPRVTQTQFRKECIHSLLTRRLAARREFILRWIPGCAMVQWIWAFFSL